MRRNKNAQKLICLVLTISILLSFSACGFVETVKDVAPEIADTVVSTAGNAYDAARKNAIKLYGTAKDSAVYVYEEASEATSTGYNFAAAKATELIGNAEDFVSGLLNEEETESEATKFDSNHAYKDLPKDVSFDKTDSHLVADIEIERFIAYYISSLLTARNYDVYNGAVYYKDNVYGGLIFTKNETFIEEDGNKISSCGFIQLVDKGYSGVRVTDNMVSTGLIAISTATQGETTQAFIVDEYISLDDFSGIFDDHYFYLHQTDHYVLEILITDNDSVNYVAGTELYDFDNLKYVVESNKDLSEVEELYINENESFIGATETVNAIVDMQENVADEDTTAVFVLDSDALQEIISASDNSGNEIAKYIKKTLKKVKLGDSQFLGINSDGHVTLYGEEIAENEEQVTDGLIEAIGSGLATAGSVASIVCVCSSGVVIVKAIIITTGTMAVVYNVSNMLEGIQDVYYGVSGKEDEATNLALEAFKKIIDDEETAKLVYHCWGIGCTVITNLGKTATKALEIAKCNGLSSYQASVSVIRASLVKIGEVLITGAGAGIVSNYVTKVVARVTGSDSIGRLVGFGGALVTGLLIYTGLDTIDQNLNISGLYPKEVVFNNYVVAKAQALKTTLENDDISGQEGAYEAFINDICEVAAEYYELPNPPTVSVVYDTNNVNYYGSYNYAYNTIEINMSCPGNWDVWELSNTIGHEMCHAAQWEYAPEDGDVFYSLTHYVSPTESIVSYESQACEIEANQAGSDFADMVLEYMLEIIS